MDDIKVVPFTGTPEQEKELKSIIESYKGDSKALINVLHKAQEIYGYLPVEVQKMVANGLNMSLTEVYGVITFYTLFTLKPKGKYKIAVCLGTACYVKGAGDIIDKVKQITGVQAGGCSDDMKFSLDATRCIGACGLAPVMTINDDVYGKLVVDDVADILAKY